MEVVFRGATVVDGTGVPRRRAHVGVAGGRIAAVVPADAGPPPSSARTVDAEGLVLAPGFIDMHAHSELALLTEPAHMAKVSQGVTCEVLGQDGLSYAPVDDVTLPQLRQQIAGWHGDPASFDYSWRSVGEYLDRLDRGIAVNACYLVPQGNVRALVLGWSDRPPTAVELDRMRDLLGEGLDQGAVGMSSGLTYPPGMYAGTDELVELCRVVARRLLRAAPPFLRRRRAGGVRRDGRGVAALGLPGASDPRDAELPGERGQGAGAARVDRRRAGRWRQRVPGHLPVPGRLHDAGGVAAELGRQGRTRRDAGTAARSGHPGTGPGRPGGARQRRQPRLTG